MKRAIATLACAVLLGCASPPIEAPTDPIAAMREQPERMVVVAVANPRPQAALAAGSSAAGYASLQPYLGGAQARQAIAALAQRHGLREIAAWPIRALRLHCVVLELPKGLARDALLRELAREPQIEIAQALNAFETLGAERVASYNDPYATLQRGFTALQAAQAHAGSRGEGVGVALIDTGVDSAHPDLQGRISSLRNLVDRDSGQFDRDRHGTELAGVIAAVANNRMGIVGVAPEASLRVYKACWQSGAGPARCNSFTLALALAASLDDGARVINLSLSGPPDALLSRLVARAIAAGRVVIGALPRDGSLQGFPLSVPGVIAVDSSDGPRRAGVLQAPGRDILTLAPGGRYDFGSGSSLAAAHASGVVALLLALPDAPRADAIRALLEASRSEPADSINACRALAALGRAVDCAPTR